MESISIFHVAIAGMAAYFLYNVYLGFKGSASKVCKACGFVGAPDAATRGSLGIEIVLWLCFIIPGLIYSLWRASSRHDACPQCGSGEIIPCDSPIGRKIIAETSGAGRSKLAVCTQCAKEYSADAAACPHCGFKR